MLDKFSSHSVHVHLLLNYLICRLQISNITMKAQYIVQCSLAPVALALAPFDN